MKFFNILVNSIMFLQTITGARIEINCPHTCKCDKYEGLRRATCHNRNLITIEADVPKEVEILDMSFNHISELNDHIFAVSCNISY